MPQFTYTAMDASGKEQKGKITAASEEAVAAELKSKGMFPTMIKEIGGQKKNQKGAKGKKKASGFNMTIGTVKIKRKELTIVTRQLAILLSAGLPLIRSLRTLEKQAKNPAVKQILPHLHSTLTLHTIWCVVSGPHFYIIHQRPVMNMEIPAITRIDRIGESKRMGNSYNTSIFMDGYDRLVNLIRKDTSPVRIALFFKHDHMSPVCGPLQTAYRHKSIFPCLPIKFFRSRRRIMICKCKCPIAFLPGCFY